MIRWGENKDGERPLKHYLFVKWNKNRGFSAISLSKGEKISLSQGSEEEQ